MLVRTTLAVLWLAAVVGGRAGAQVAGTYELRICAEPCSDTGATVLRGHVVLFADPVNLDTVPAHIRSALADGARWLVRSQSLNGCFAIPGGPTRVDGKELYAGIVPRGFTRWEVDGSRVRVPVYRSPDAHYTLAGALEAGTYTGRGEQAICCGAPDPPATWFVARRTGPADVTVCL